MPTELQHVHVVVIVINLCVFVLSFVSFGPKKPHGGVVNEDILLLLVISNDG